MPKPILLFNRGSLLRFALALIATGVGAANATAQTCKAADNHSAFMLGDLKFMSSSPDEIESYQRRDLKIPVVDTTTIVLVTNQQVCNKVLAPFLATLPSDWPSPLPSSLYVAKVGTVYVGMVVGPSGTAHTYAVVDSKYKLLSTYSQ